LVTCSTERQEDQGILEAGMRGLPPEGFLVVGTSAAFRPEDLGLMPEPQTRLERLIPHDSILPQAAVVVCHGGMGVAQRSLAHGVPLVVVPFGRDQLEVARRVEHAGAGVMLPPKKLTAASLAVAVRRARDLADGAGRVAAAFAESGGESAAAGVVEELLNDPRAATYGASI
jgi:UDP:flavonoid glycosyltransferase YjiC (YdhE family)